MGEGLTFRGPLLGARRGTGYGSGESLERFATALASIVCGAVLTPGDALALSSLGLHPWTS